MQDYKGEFLRFAAETGVLRFGEFTLKSGRKSPYFFNAGLFNSGARLARLGRFYASAILDSGIRFDVLYGPAYKGIPLAATTSIALADHHQRDVPYAFNRKEAKDHGEGGDIIGSPLAGDVLIIDDVITAGASVREATDVILRHGARLAGVVIALDRQERGQGPTSAVQEVRQEIGVPVLSIATLSDLVAYLEQQPGAGGPLQAVKDYRALYGV